jgi:hypothetical protein
MIFETKKDLEQGASRVELLYQPSRGRGPGVVTPLFELGDELQCTPIELGDGNDTYQCVLRLRRGAPVNAGLVQELNDLFGNT